MDLRAVRVLIVEDEAFSQQLLSRVLTKLGLTKLATVSDGKEALSALGKNPHDFDLIISDIEMPNMDGYEFVRKLRYGSVPECKDIPVLILTGKDTDKNVQRARFHKINGFIVKPPQPEDLRRKIEKALGD